MITNIRILQIIYLVPIFAIAMLGAVLLFPDINYASSEPETQSTTKQTESHNRLINESSPYLLQHAIFPDGNFNFNSHVVARKLSCYLHRPLSSHLFLWINTTSETGSDRYFENSRRFLISNFHSLTRRNDCFNSYRSFSWIRYQLIFC